MAYSTLIKRAVAEPPRHRHLSSDVSTFLAILAGDGDSETYSGRLRRLERAGFRTGHAFRGDTYWTLERDISEMLHSGYAVRVPGRPEEVEFSTEARSLMERSVREAARENPGVGVAAQLLGYRLDRAA